MGKDAKHKQFRHRSQKPYSRNNLKNQKPQYQQRNSSHKKTSNRCMIPKVTLREDQVGITEFTTDCEGFTGILKSRFSDFHVNEIDTNGSVLVLNDLNVPKASEPCLTEEQLADGRKKLEALIEREDRQKIEELSSAKANNSQSLEAVEIDVSALNKEQRTEIHKVLKQLYNETLVSTTKDIQQKPSDSDGENKEAKKFICITKPKGGREKRQRWLFTGEYVYFLVYKENMDTSEVAVALADRLNLRPSQVNYCGTKDKRAKTTQKFCIKYRTPSQIVGACKSIRGAHVGNFEFSKEVLKLGNLSGNRFRIALRHITSEHSKIVTALQALSEHGFINYFGLQRFGNCASVPTYQVGVALLKSDYKLACELILKPRDNDLQFMREIRNIWWEKRDSAAAAAMFHNNTFIEKKLLDGLSKFGENDYAAALRRIPRNMLLLYTHAVQSIIFNQIASRRVKEYGLKMIPGDLVYRNKDERDTEFEIDTAVELSQCEEAIDEGQFNIANSVETTDVEKTPDVQTVESIFKRKVKPLTETDIASGNFTIFDIVLPLPGYDVTFPTNETGQWYESMLMEFGLTVAKLKHNVKTYALAGAYRKLFIKPGELKWYFRKYTNDEEALITSDWEQLKNLLLPNPAKNAVEDLFVRDSETFIKGQSSASDAKRPAEFSALILEFSLPSAAYATMLLRELMKADTSTMHQMQLELSVQNKNDNALVPANKANKPLQTEIGENVSYAAAAEDADAEKRKLDETKETRITEEADQNKKLKSST